MMKCISVTLISLLFSATLIAQVPVSVKIDFGNTNLSPLPWNNLTNPDNGRINNLIDSRGIATEMNIELTDSFNGINNTGTDSPDASLELPASATGDSFFGNLVEFSGSTEPTAAVQLQNLVLDRTYDLSLFASRIATDNRQTEYIVTAENIDTAYLQVADNSTDKVNFTNLRPADDGTITISCTAGPENNNGNNFYYLGAVELFYMDTLVEVEAELSLVYPNGGEYWQANKEPEIRWQSQGIDDVSLAYSIDQGTSWVDIAEVNAISQAYAWIPPSIESTDVLVRVSSDQLSDQSDDFFSITTADTSSCHIVVLGSSTAAGTGPSMRDSAWVWRYEDHIFQRDTRFEVTNLARGGYTTYNLLPDGTEIPPGVDQTIDSDRNVTAARALTPDAVIINLPSNDAARGYTVTDQLLNYRFMTDSLSRDSIVYWIATPQPRNGFNTDQKQIQLDLRDSTFTNFGEFAIDFWNGFEDAANNLDPSFDSGDGVHMNDEGHYILFRRVLERLIPNFLLSEKAGITSTEEVTIIDRYLEVSPNPFQDSILLKAKLEGSIQLELYNKLGQLSWTKKLPFFDQQESLDVSGLTEGLYYLVVTTEQGQKIVKSVYKN